MAEIRHKAGASWENTWGWDERELKPKINTRWENTYEVEGYIPLPV